MWNGFMSEDLLALLTIVNNALLPKAKSTRIVWDMQFPSVSGNDLLRNKVSLPDDLSSGLNVLIVAFQRWHQGLVNSWVPFLDHMLEKHQDFDYYELPTIRKMNWLSRSIIDNGMRTGIPSRNTRRRTITLYIDKEPFRKKLSIPDESDIHLFLASKDGEVLWAGSGAISEDKADALTSAIEKARANYQNQNRIT
jgi:hypothetical protein